MFRTVDYLLRPKSIAIVGASDSSRGGWAQSIYDNLEYCGFPAKIYPVNPRRSEVWGRKVFRNFAAIPEPVDLALTIVPTAAVIDALAEAAVHGLKCALVFAARFGEGGDPEGVTRAQAQWLELSSNAKQLFTDKSSEYIPFDQPDFVVDAIREVFVASK